MSARSVTNEVSTAANPTGDMDTLKRLIELQSQLVELSRRNAATEKSVALLRQEVAQIRRGEIEKTAAPILDKFVRPGLISVLRARVRQLPKMISKGATWPINFNVSRSTAP